MTFPHRRFGAALLLASTLVLVTACVQDTEAAPNPTDGGILPTESAPAPTETESEAPATADPTCDTIIPATTVADFESVGWTFEESTFYIGELEVPDGLMCVWADFDAPAGDHLQLFGWSEISQAQAEDAQTSLIEQGWIREDSAEGVYITENPETTISVDDEGYGMTYLFTEGAVELADTKQGLILVEWPQP